MRLSMVTHAYIGKGIYIMVVFTPVLVDVMGDMHSLGRKPIGYSGMH